MQRHDLVWLHPSAIYSAPCVEFGSAEWSALADWLAIGRPLVAARQTVGTGRVQLGLSLPLVQSRKRLSILVDPSQIAEVRPSLSVRQCMSRLPPDQAASLLEVASSIETSGARLGIYGSLAWESLSGELYRHDASDIDLICDVADLMQYEIALTVLAQAIAKFPCRLDGELRFPDGRSVAWQEILTLGEALGKPVLVKGEQEVALLPLADVLASLPPVMPAA
jgi:phosphoribosyl-dephospho-CoA transferase